MAKKIAIFLALLVIVTARPVETEDASSSIKVGIYNNPPLVFMENNVPKGFFVELLQHIGKAEQWNFDFVYCEWKECLRLIKHEKLDILPTVAYSEERARQFDFNISPVFINWGELYTGKNLTLSSIQDINGKIVAGVMEDIYTEAFAKMANSLGLQIRWLFVKDYDEVFEAVGQDADFGIASRLFGLMHLDKYKHVTNSLIFFTPTRLGFIAPKGKHEDLLKTIDYRLESLKANSNSIYYTLLDKWINQKQSKPLLESRFVYVVMVILSLSTLCFLIISLTLKKLVAKKTESLQQALERYETEAHLKREAEHSLHWTEISYTTLFRNLPLAVLIVDEEGFVLDFNERVSQLFGKDASPHKHLSDLSFYSKNEEYSLDTFLNILDCAFQGFEREVEWSFRAGENPIFFTHINLRKIIFKGDLRVAIFIKDITDIKKAQKALQERWSFLQSCVDNMPLPMFVIDNSGKVVIWNKASEFITTIRKSDMLGKFIDLRNIFGGRDLAVPALLLLEKEPQELELTFKGKIRVCKDYPEAVETYGWIWVNDQKRHVNIVAGRIRDSEGNLIGVLQCAADITDQFNLQNALAQMQKMEAIGRLSAGITHDLNNLLTIIMGSCDMISLELVTNESTNKNLEHYLTQIREAAARGSNIGKQLQHLASPREYYVQNLDLNRLVEEVMDSLKQLLGEDIEIYISLDPKVGKVKLDRLHLEQVCLNLIINARDAMPHGGKIQVKTAKIKLDEDLFINFTKVPKGSYVILSVADTGEGIDPANFKKIFEPYFSTKANGTGLGLSIVYSLINQAGGYVTVDSTLGVGTVFNIYIPLYEESHINIPHMTTTLKDVKLLLVEDDTCILDIVSHALSFQGCYVIVSSTGEEAKASWTKYKDDIKIVISDVVLPDMTGKSLFDVIRNDNAEITFIFISGYPSHKLSQYDIKISEENNVFFLEKPFKIESLINLISMALTKKEKGS